MDPTDKALLRTRIATALGAIPEDAAVTRAARLPARVKAISDLSAHPGALMGYLAMAGELDVSGTFWLAWSYGRKVCVPSTDWQQKRITPVLYTPARPISKGKHGVPEIEGPREVPLSEIGVVLVPGVAFTKTGLRIGRGGGFYDRFLARLLGLGEARPVFVGVCFSEQIVDDLPCEAHDVPMDLVVDV